MSKAQGIAQSANQGQFKNRIINGAMTISQRGTSFTLVSGVTQYTLDRWYANTTGGTGVVSQASNIGSYARALRITGASGVTSSFAGQKIESVNSVDLVGSAVTVSVQLSSSTLTSIQWYARTPTAVDNYAGVNSVANGTITINSTPTTYTFSFTAPSSAANGLEIFFLTGAFTSGTLDITGVQLEKGSTATSFDYRPYGTELQLCQRYCVVLGQSGGETSVGSGIWYASTAAVYQMRLPVEMRANPTLTNVSPTLQMYIAGAALSATAPTINRSSRSSVEFYTPVSSGSTTAGHGTSVSYTAGSSILASEL